MVSTVISELSSPCFMNLLALTLLLSLMPLNDRKGDTFVGLKKPMQEYRALAFKPQDPFLPIFGQKLVTQGSDMRNDRNISRGIMGRVSINFIQYLTSVMPTKAGLGLEEHFC